MKVLKIDSKQVRAGQLLGKACYKFRKGNYTHVAIKEGVDADRQPIYGDPIEGVVVKHRHVKACVQLQG